MSAQELAQQELRRLTWHSRRGMLELDVLLLPFTENHFMQLNETDKAVYRRLIDCEDQDLFNWFMEKSRSPDDEIQRMVEVILAHARQG
ncbi:succinate dehydrogenase assembly factor 2 [Reinekea thalattae]|uniref:FAD assembly factor SdhE n=2 Tax=Reinekea thalattae TaxID=2593301 RepID=A0A5C8ZC92_9GAMM|nr:succinate dehydrogenase assembly factor 2 [Reinekea thalattae]TXR54909.1 succinate dehydrogenase assembly factor 2 [Reinekea thalattae]